MPTLGYKRDYSDIADQVVEAYKRLRNIADVARLFHLGTATVSSICKDAGVLPKRKPVGRPTEKPDDDDTCYFCRAYSRTGVLDGWCLTHRRMTRAKAKEHCFKE